MTNAKKRSQFTNHLHLTSCTSSTYKPVMKRCLLSVAIASSLLVVGCNDDDDKITYKNAPQHIASFTTSQIDAELAEATPFGKDVTPNAKCGVTVEKISYQTKGSGGEDTNATAALMLPSGSDPACKGDRPVLLHAHGTAVEKTYDFTQVGNTDNTAGVRATLMAANFAAQGYIVVAPNYAGYDTSTLDYHPYLNAKQQSEEMVTALDTARTLIKQQQNAKNSNYLNIKDSGKLFLTGYSQGGHVVMTTARLLEQQNKPVTAIAPSSGPYALAAFGDVIFAGNVNLGSTKFAPLLALSLQKVNNDIYRNPTEIFTPQYANTVLPNNSSFADLVKDDKISENALFQKAPTGNPAIDQLPASPLEFASVGFNDSKYLVQTSFRAAYLADVQANPDGLLAPKGDAMTAANPQNNLRKALKENDVRDYIPKMPTLICGGNQDPTVFFDINTGSVASILQKVSANNPAAKLNVTILDVDATNSAKRPDKSTLTMIGNASTNSWDIQSIITGVQGKFAGTLQKVATDAAAQGVSPQVAVLSNYHASLVSTACTNATRQFFDQEFKSS